jgi:uncharacterized protein YecA (UPF0149 family)
MNEQVTQTTVTQGETEDSRFVLRGELEHFLARPRVLRNDPCPCGSGRKYKRCCLGKQRKRTADDGVTV